MASIYIGKQGCFKYAFRGHMRVQCISAFKNGDCGFLDHDTRVTKIKSSRELMNMLKRISRNIDDYAAGELPRPGEHFWREDTIWELMDVVNKNMQRKEK